MSLNKFIDTYEPRTYNIWIFWILTMDKVWPYFKTKAIDNWSLCNIIVLQMNAFWNQTEKLTQTHRCTYTVNLFLGRSGGSVHTATSEMTSVLLLVRTLFSNRFQPNWRYIQNTRSQLWCISQNKQIKPVGHRHIENALQRETRRAAMISSFHCFCLKQKCEHACGLLATGHYTSTLRALNSNVEHDTA